MTRPTGWLAVSKAAELRPDVVVMDVRMPRLNGIEATRQLVALTPKPPRVVLLTTFDLDEYVFDGLLAGASGFLLKHAPPEEILLAVRACIEAIIKIKVVSSTTHSSSASAPPGGASTRQPGSGRPSPRHGPESAPC